MEMSVDEKYKKTLEEIEALKDQLGMPSIVAAAAALLT